MPFFVALVFLLYSNLIVSLNSFRQGKLCWLGVSHFAASNFGTAGVLLGFGILDVMRVGISPSSTNLVPLCFFLFGAVSLAIFSLYLYRIVIVARVQKEVAKIRLGAVVWSVMASVYIVFTVCDHWWFFRDPQHSGVAAIEFLGADDVDCRGMALVKLEGPRAVYRCPETIAWGGMFRQWPFVPWPSYREGESKKLADGILQVQQEAERKKGEEPSGAGARKK